MIDLVILDLSMPGMDGLKCLEELLRFDPAIKVIIASGYSMKQKVQEAMGLGAIGYLMKPYQCSDILKKIREVFDH